MSRISNEVRQQVIDRAEGRCEYCRMPDAYATFGHQVDHIVPHRHGGTDDIDNLAWACFPCNNNKSIDIASYDFETNELTLLFNPRKHLWDDHFVIVEGAIMGLTKAGRVTARLLKMNAIERIDTRRDLIDAGLW